MKLFEMFDNPFPYKWIQKSREYWRATFDVNNIEYSASFRLVRDFVDSNGNDVRFWTMGFTPTENGLSGVELNNVSGKEIRVFSTVVSAGREFINLVKPKMFSFSAHKFKSNRFSLYLKILNRFKDDLDRLGYKESECPVYKHDYLDLSNYETFCMKRKSK